MNVGSHDSSWIFAWACVMLVRLKAVTLSVLGADALPCARRRRTRLGTGCKGGARVRGCLGSDDVAQDLLGVARSSSNALGGGVRSAHREHGARLRHYCR